MAATPAPKLPPSSRSNRRFALLAACMFIAVVVGANTGAVLRQDAQTEKVCLSV